MRIEPYEMNVFVNSYQTDTMARLSMVSLFQIFQEAAYRHAEALGWGREYLLSHNQFWALTRAVMEIDRLPEWNETLIIRTAPREGEGLMAPRDLLLIDSQGKTCVKASTFWIIMDINSRRPVPPKVFFSGLEFSEKCRLCCLPYNKMHGTFSDKPLYSSDIYYSSLDMNNHVNNSNYIKYLLDGLSVDENEKEIGRLQIVFQQEAAAGDKLVIYRGEDENGSLMLKGLLGDKESVTARIIFRT
jgi:medium-chain acyl-[acyl-carrier-protein] hydrolase